MASGGPVSRGGTPVTSLPVTGSATAWQALAGIVALALGGLMVRLGRPD